VVLFRLPNDSERVAEIRRPDHRAVGCGPASEASAGPPRCGCNPETDLSTSPPKRGGPAHGMRRAGRHPTTIAPPLVGCGPRKTPVRGCAPWGASLGA
jgi:hypothetical protein